MIKRKGGKICLTGIHTVMVIQPLTQLMEEATQALTDFAALEELVAFGLLL